MARAGLEYRRIPRAGAREHRREGRTRRRRLRQTVDAAAVRRRRLRRRGDVRRAAHGADGPRAIRPSLPRSHRGCSPAVGPGWPSQRRRTRASSSRSRSAATWRRPRRSTSRCAKASRSARSSASTTISARSRCRTCSTSASPTRSSSRSGTATTSRACRSRWPSAVGVAGRGRFYEEVGALRDVVQNHLLQVVSLLAMEAPVAAATRRSATRRRRRSVRCGPSRRTTWCAASSSAIATKPAWRKSHRSRPSRPSVSTSTHGDGPACRSTFAPASTWP